VQVRSLKPAALAADPFLVARYVDVVAEPRGAERRTSPRIELEIEVGWETDSNFYTGLTQDISTGGLFVATHHLRRVGERIAIRFGVPGSPTPIEVECEVRWLRESRSYSVPDDSPTGMGLKLIGLPAQARLAISTFLRKRDSIFYDDE